MLQLELTMNSDSILSVMSSEDFSKFAASDIGDAVKRVSESLWLEASMRLSVGLETAMFGRL